MNTMSNKGDDCYFYYYSTCAKGDACPFRHCEAAMGNETVCSLWQENRCFRSVCKFRHMEIKKNRKEIPCFWENQPTGCQKFHCAFHHEKPRFIDGVFVAPDKGTVVKEDEEETPQDDQLLSVPASNSSNTNPQLRGVIKVEAQESVPSPTHPPVVINPVDDEDDEDDQFSEEGEEASGVSPKNVLSSNRDESLNFGIKTLEELRLEKALKANLNRPAHPTLQGPDGLNSAKHRSSGTGTEKETSQSVTQATVVIANESLALDNSRKRKITDRLGKRFHEEMHVEGGLQLKGSLAKRLGGFVDPPENKMNVAPQKVKTLRPVRERLGITSDITAPKSPNSESRPSGEIRIKTLEEIRQERAAKTQMQCKGVRVVTEVPTNALTSTKRVNKPVTGPFVKTFSEVLREKKLQETKVVPLESSTNTEKTESPKNTGMMKMTTQAAEIRVKTLEEIRKEKAARMQAKTQDTTNDTPSSNSAVPKKRIICIGKTGSSVNKESDSQKVDCTEESTVINGKSDPSVQDVMVKSFEEILQEKKLRKQQEQAASTVEPEQETQKPDPVFCEKKSPTVIRSAKSSIKQGINDDASSPIPSLVPQKLSPEKQENSLTINPKKSKHSASMALPVQVSAMADSSGHNSPEPHCENTQAVIMMPPSKAAELKVRPKLNVKPSVMKPAAQVKPGQKRKAANLHCSAVAAVKPLNTAFASDVESPCKLSVIPCSSETEARVPQVTSPGEQCSPAPLSVSKSPSIKTPSQTRPRRTSVASAHSTAPAGNSSTMDEFEVLLDEFTDDRLDDELELDPGKGEDDLLLELSEMIDN